jgi:IclR family pca regulon transcriptional regulator
MNEKPVKRRSAGAAPWSDPAVSEAERLNHWTGDPSFMLSLARGLLVLEAVAEAGGRTLSIAEIAAATGLSRPTVRRCLYTLDALSYLKTDRSGGTAGPRLAGLSAAYLAGSPLLSNSRPVLDRLRDATGQTVSLGIREGSEAVYISHSYSDTFFTINIPPGARFPLYSTSMGRVLLSGMPPAEFEAYLAQASLTPHTEYTVKTADDLRAMVLEDGKRGYSISDQEVEVGLRTISVPVKDRRGQIVAAISIGTHASVVGVRELRSVLLPAMLEAAKELSDMLP